MRHYYCQTDAGALWDTLSKPLRDAFFIQKSGKSYREIGEILHIPLGTVKSRLARARDQAVKIGIDPFK